MGYIEELRRHVMDKEVKIFFIIIFICMIVISIISVGLILKRRKVLVIVGLVILTVELIVAIIFHL